jgi:hypothetical protein
MALANDPLAEIAGLIEASVEENTNFTTCPVCLSGVDPTSLHKEPYMESLPGDAAVTGMIRRVLHLRRPDGQWDTCSILEYE